MRACFAQRVSAIVLAGVTLLSFPTGASAYDVNKTPLIFEIKNFPKIFIPMLIEKKTEEKIEVEATPIVVEEDPVKIETDPETGKVYMHEPSIKAYVCPKLGAKCKTFIAILKAENG